MSHIMRKPLYAIDEQHRRSLISAFVARCLDSINFKTLASAEQAGLNHTWSQTPEDRFSRDEAHMKTSHISEAFQLLYNEVLLLYPRHVFPWSTHNQMCHTIRKSALC